MSWNSKGVRPFRCPAFVAGSAVGLVIAMEGVSVLQDYESNLPRQNGPLLVRPRSIFRKYYHFRRRTPRIRPQDEIE